MWFCAYVSISATPHGQVPMPLVATQLCSASGVLIRLSRFDALTVAGGALLVKGCVPLGWVSCSAPVLPGLLGTCCRAVCPVAFRSSQHVHIMAQLNPFVKWTVERSGTMLPKSLGMTRFLNVLNKGSTDRMRVTHPCQHMHTQYHRVFHLSRTGTYRHTRMGEVAPRHSVYRLEKFLLKYEGTSTEAPTSPFNAHHTCRYTKEQ